MFGIRCISRWTIHLICIICIANASVQLLLSSRQASSGSVVFMECLATQAGHAFSDTAVEANCYRPHSTSWQPPHATPSSCRTGDPKAASKPCGGMPDGFRTSTHNSLIGLGIGLRL